MRKFNTKGVKLKIMRVVSLRKTIVNEKKEKKSFTNYYLELDNGELIAFKPCFPKTDYSKLRAVAVRLDKLKPVDLNDEVEKKE